MARTADVDPETIETVTVDSYGTLVDPLDTRRALAERVADPDPIARDWRARSLSYTMVGNAVGFYQPFYEMNRDALAHAAAVHGADLGPEAVDEILAAYHDLPAYDDVRGGIGRIAEAGYDVYVVSNGNPEMLDTMVDSAGLGDVLAGTVSADEVKRFKPEPEIYRHAAARTGTPIDRILHVAGPSFDVLGAMNAGMAGGWLNRDGGRWEDFTGRDPDLVVESFHDVADLLAD